MADFDKDLQPIIKPSGYKATNIPIGPGMNFSTPGGGGVSDLSQKEDVFSELAAAGQKFSQKGLFISNAELEANKRYKTFNPTIGDYEDFAAQGQEWYKQATNGVLKGANLAATTIAGGFGMLYGVGKAVLFTQKLSDVWDNEINRGLQKWNEKVDNEFLPNYYTAAERNAEWYSTDNWFTTNFLFDKLIKNSGYAVGAMVGGNIANAGLLKLGSTLGNALAKGATAAEASQAFKLFTPLLRNTSRAFSAGKNKEAAALLESKISSIADLSAKASQMANISKQTGQFARFSDAARRTAVATYSSAGEASFEALHTAKEYRDNLIDEYTRKNGYEPTGEELKNIDLQAEKVGKTSFFGNMALLSITEFNQLPYLIGSSYGPSRQAINSLLGRVDNAAVDDALKGIKAAPKTKFGKIYEGTRRAGVYVFDPKESMQEVLQYGLQVGTQNYFKKSEQGGEADLFVDGFLYGLFGKDEFGEGVGAFVSKEGIEGGILGGITGAVMQARGNYQERKALAKNTENFLNMLENAPTFKEAFQDKLDGTNRGVVLQQQERDAILNGDKLEAIDLRVDGIHNYLAPRIKYGRFDMVMDDLNELKQSGMTESGLAELKEQGMANINDDVNSFQKRITSIENTAKNLNDMYQSLNIRYAGETIEVDGEERRKYSPITIDKLAYAASKIANYDVRIPQLNGNLISAGINTQAILNDIISTGTPNVEATKEALDTINSMNVTSDVKDELKGQLDDVIELSLRRKMFIEEYDSIKNNPLNYERPEKEVDKVDILQKEGRKKLQKTLEVGKEYSLTDPISLEKGKLILAPKFTVLSSTLGGEFEVLLPDGTTTFFSPEQFNKYSLTEETNTSQEMEDALNQAIDEVFGYPAFRNVLKRPEEGVNKLAYVNSLGNQKFTKAIINRFNKLTEAIREAKAKEKEAADKLKEQKEDIDKQQNDVANQPGDPSVDEIQFDTRIDSGETGPLKTAAKFFNSSSNESDDPNYKFYNPNPAPHIIRSRVFLNNAKNNKKRDKFRAITFTYNQENDLGLSGITELSYGKNWEANKNKVNDLINGFVAQVYVEVEGKNRYFIDKNGDRIKNAQGQDIKVGEQVDLSKVIFETRPTAVEYSSADGDRFRTNEKDEFLRNMEIWKRQREILLGNPAENIAPMAAKDLPTNSFIISKGFAITTPKVDGKYVKNKVGETLVQESQISTQSGLLKISTGDNIIHSGETMKAKLGLVYLQFRDTLQVLNNNVLGAKKGKVVYEVIKSLINDMQSQALSGKPVSLDRQKLLYLRSVLNYAKPTAEMSSNQLWIDIESMSIKLGNKPFSFSDFINKEAESVSALANTYHAANKRTLDKGQSYLEFVFEDGKLSTVKWPNYQSYLISGKNRNIDEIPFVTNVAKTSDAIPYNFRGKYATVQNFSVGEKNTDFNNPTQQQAPEAPPAASPVGKSEANSASDPPPSLPAMKIGNFNINDGSTNTVQVGTQKVNTIIDKGEIVDGKLFIEVSFDFDDPVNQTAVQNIQNNPAFKSTYFASWKAALPELNDDSTEEETIGAYFRNQIKAQLLDAFNAQQQAPAPEASQVGIGKLEKPFKQKNDGSGLVTVKATSKEKDGFTLYSFETKTTNTKGEERSQPYKSYNSVDELIDDIGIIPEEGETVSELKETLENIASSGGTIAVQEVRFNPETKVASATIIIGGVKSEVNIKYDSELAALEGKPVEAIINSSKGNLEKDGYFAYNSNYSSKQDAVYADENLFIVADGMGSYSESGQFAKELVEAIAKLETKTSAEIKRVASDVSKKYTKGATTLSLVEKTGKTKEFRYYSIGDSPIYIFDKNGNVRERINESINVATNGILAFGDDKVFTNEQAIKTGTIQLNIGEFLVVASDGFGDVFAGIKDKEYLKAIKETLLEGNKQLFDEMKDAFAEGKEDDFSIIVIKPIEEPKPSAEKTTPPPAEEPISPPKSKKGRFKSGYDDARALSKGEAEAEKISQRDIEVFKTWWKKNVPNIPFEILDNIITLHDGRKAWGVFENGVAKFFKSGLRGTEYHEIFEGIWKGFLSENERQIILDEFKNKPGDFLDRESGRRILFSEATDRQAKERIADDFADYRVGKLPARNLSERIRRFFKAIVDFFKSFVNKPSLKDELFKAIDSGRFREAILPESVKVAQPEYRKEMVIADGSTLFEDEAYNFVQDMAISIAGYILNRENDNTVENVFEFKKVTGTQAYNFLRDKYTEVGNFEQIGEKVFNELYLRTVDQLRIMGISIDAESIQSINDGDGNNRLYSPEAFEVDFKKNMKFAIKFLISSLPAAEKSELDKFGKPVLKKGAADLAILSNFNRNFATLLSKLSDTSLEKIPEKLYELYKEDGNYYRLVRALRGDMSAENAESLFDFENFKDNDWKLYIQFTQAFNKSKPNSFVESRNKSIDGISVVTKPAEKASAINVVKYNWLSNVKQLSTEGGSMIKREKLSYFIDVEHPNYPKTLPKTNEERLKFLENIGINFPASAIPKDEKGINDFVKSFNSIYNYGSKNIADSGNFTNADSSVIKLASIYVNSLNPDHDTTRLNVENKRTGNYSDSNAVSVFEEIFNESKSIDELLQHRPELRDVYSKNSVILKKGGYFFDENGDKIEGRILKVGVVDGINENDGGTTITSLTKGERFTLEINQNLRGEYYILIPADSSTERTLNVGNNISFADTNTEAGDKEFFEIMKNYLNDEIELALDWRNRKQLAAIGETRAKQLRMFREILDEDLIEQIEKVVADGRLSKDGARKKIKEILKDNSSKIETSFKSTVEYLNNKLDGDLKSTGQVMNVSPERIEYPYLDNDFIQDNKIDKNEMSIDDYNRLLSFINMNQMIASIEIHKFIFGDPYQFKTTAEGNLEATKRFKSWLSPRRKTFDSQAYNDFLNDEYNKTADKTDLPGDDLTRYKFRSSVTTVTLTDPKPISRYIDRMKEYVDYEGYDESDGFSLIQIGAYREVKLKNAEWPKEAETWYQWQMAYTRQKLSGLKKADGKAAYSYGDNTWLKKHDEELIKKREPYYVLEVLKPIVSGAKPNLDRIEGDIDKYSQMPVFFKAVEGTALQDLYVQMLEQETGYVVYKSGRKEGARGTHNLYKNGKINTDKFGEDTIEEIAWSTYGIQVDNTYEEDKNQTRVSQLMKNASMDMFENGKEVMSGAAKIVQEIESNHDEYHQLQYDEFLEKLGIKDLGTSFEIVDAKKVSETLEYELLRREASENTIDTIRLDEGGKFRIPFEASSAYEEIQRVLYSIINKSLISPSMEGKPYVQVPATGWENKEEGRELIRRIKTADGFKYEPVNQKQFDAMSEEDKKTVYLASSKLKFYENEDGKRHMEVMIPNYWKKYFKGMSDEEVLKYLNKKENQKILFGVGARIPHQAMSSTEIFKVVGFLHPSMGSTIVVPSEIVKKAGSDFDIDKLNTYLKAVYLDDDKKVKMVEYKGSKEKTLAFYGGVYDRKFSKQLDRLVKYSNFRKTLIEVYDLLDTIADEDYYSENIEIALGKDLYKFFVNHEDLIEEIAEQADQENLSPSEYIEDQINRLSETYNEIESKRLDEVLKAKYANRMYKKSLENRYYELLQQLVTLPENFSRLMTPVSDAGLPAVAKELDKARGEEEGSEKHKLFSKSFLTSLRHAFTLGKKWVGIVAVNITGHAIAQRINAYIDPSRLSKIDKYDASFLGDMSLVVPHNTVTVDGEERISLAGRNTAYSRKDKKGEPLIEFISDRLSGYASAVVDVAKDPFIMRILNSDLVVGTAMFMERIGAGELTPFFLNQPIIIDYLKYLDRIGNRALFSDNNITQMYEKYPISAGKSYDLRNDFPIDPETKLVDFEKSKARLLSSIDINAKRDEEFNLKQHAVFKEFLKIAKMAQYSFKFTQAYNYDTTRVRTTEGVLRKALRTDIAEEANIISSVNDVFKKTFIGKQRELIIKEVKSLSAIFKLDNDVFYNIIDEVLKPFASQEYMSLDDFDRVVKKVKTGMIDYLVQTKSPVFSKSIITNLISGQNNIGKQLSTLQKKYPESELLSNFETRFSKYEEGAVTVTMKAKPSDAATINRYIAMMRELKALEPEFYKNLVLVSLLQGTYDTRIAINKIVPLEDRAEIIAPLINATYSQADLQNFSRQGVFFRTNFSDSSIVPEYTPKFLVTEGQFGYQRTGFIKLDGTDSTPGNGRVLRLSKAYSRFNNAEMDFLKVKRYQYAKGYIFDITGERKPIRWRLTKGETGIDFATLVQNGDVNQYEMVGYKKVKDSSGEPLTDEKDNVYFKMVNLYGDGDLVKLYRIDGLPSTIKNNTYPVKQELSDDTVIKAVNNEIISSPQRIIEQPTEVSQQSSQVYSQLGNKTQSENIVISNIKTKDGKYDREANIKEAQENNRIYSMETNSNLSFSNPWASFKRGDTINTSTTKEAVQNYIDWLITDKFKDIKPERRAWILNQLKLGSLKEKTIQYYAELNEPSHATALDYLINKYDWSTVTQPTVETSQSAGQPSTPTTSTSNKVERSERIINRSELRANPKTLYLFGDNDVRKGLGGQAREMRNEPNAIGISTKKLPATSEQSYKTDAELESNKTIITNDINKAIAAWDSEKYNRLVIPPMGVGLAELPTRAPQTYEFLQQELQRLENHVNGVRQPTTPTTPEQVVPETPIVETVLDTKVDNFRYYGAPYQIVLDVDGKPISVVGYRGSKSKMQAILDAYLENPNVDPQNKKPFRKESGEVIEEQPSTVKSKFTYKGTTIDTEFELTEGQKQALEKLIDFATDSSSKFITLQGAAGTGKTSVIGYLQKYLKSSTFNFFAPTHAATAELAFATVKTGNRMMPMTVASALNQAYDPVTNKSSAILTRKITDRLGLRNNVFIIDEVSMLNSKDYDALKSIIDNSKIKVIFMGDIMQIPEVDSQNPKKKLVSKAFTDHDQVILTEVKRTRSNSILNMLVNVRNNINDKIPVVESSGELEYLPTSEFNEEIANKFEKDPEETVLINYRNVGVEGYNKKIRSVLGRVGELVPSDVIVGYLGYSSKQIDKGNIANSIRYTVQSVVKSGSVYRIAASSKKLQALEDLGVSGVSGIATTNYMQLSRNDSFDFPNLTEEDFDKNNKTISNLMQQLKDAKDYALANKSKGLAWVRYYEAKDKVSGFFSSHDLGGDYIYNPSSEKMEKYSNEIHKDIDKDMRVEKGIDFGHAITIHKSQGTTVKNVFFDANSLPSGSTSKLMMKGKQIGTEKHSLLYVGISRASQYLGIHYANMANFYTPEGVESSKSGNLGFDSTLEFSEKEKTTIVSNFANKHKMTTEEARKYLNDAFAKSDAKSVIDKLKECYL